MAKNTLEDMVANENRRQSSQFFSELAKATNKKLSDSPSKSGAERSSTEKSDPATSGNAHIPVFRPSGRVRGRKGMIWIVAFVALIILFVAISTFFAKATVSLTPKIKSGDFSANLSATKDSTHGELSYQLMVVSGEYKKSAHAATKKTSDAKAVGTVALFNSYSASPQHLLINTRLEAASNHKIYMTGKAISIPGFTKKGSDIIPGSVEVAVTAVETGEGGNTALTDFSIVGFKGTPKYAKIFGRGKTPIAGGSSGEIYVLNSDEQALFNEEGKNALIETLKNKAHAELPDGYILFDGALSTSVDPIPSSISSKTDTLDYVFRGTGTGFILKKEELAKTIAKSLIPDFDRAESVSVPNLDKLTFALDPSVSDPAKKDKLAFSLSGSPAVVWDVDLKGLEGKLLGQSKKDFHSILATEKGVDTAGVVVRPIWQRTISKNPEKVLIKETITVDGTPTQVVE